MITVGQHPHLPGEATGTEKFAIFFITIVAPVALAVHLLFDVVPLIYGVKIVLGLLLLVRLPSCGAELMRGGIRSPLFWAAAFFGAELLVTVYFLQTSSDITSIGKLRGSLSATVWCAGLWLGIEYVRTPAAFRYAVRMLGWLGVLVSGSAFVSYLCFKAGISFGEIIETSDGEIRVFGPLGDNAPFLILFFFFLAFAQAKWWKVLFHGIVILLSVGRGVTVAAAVGTAMYLCTPIVQKSNLPFTRRFMQLFRHGGMIAAFALLGLTVTASGRFLISRFGTTTELIYEDRMGGRLSNMEFAWELFKARPMLGYGYYGYAEEVYRVYGNALFDVEAAATTARGITTNATNQIVQVAIDGGVVALTCFVLLIVMLGCDILDTLRRQIVPERPYAVAFGVYLVSILVGMQSTVYVIDQSSLGLFLFWIAGLSEAHRRIFFQPNGPARAPSIRAVSE